MLERYERIYKKVYKPLAGQCVKQMFDIYQDDKGTWFTAEFTNGDVHLVLIPNVHVWNEGRERILKIYPVKENAVGCRVIGGEKQNRYFVMQVGYWKAWFLFEHEEGRVKK